MTKIKSVKQFKERVDGAFETQKTRDEAKACYDFAREEFKAEEEELCAYAAANPAVFEGRDGVSGWGATESVEYTMSNGTTVERTDDEFIGREITFKVEGRCGDPEAGTQTKSIEAVLDKGDITAPKSSIVRVVCEGHESDPDILFDGGAVTIEGSGLAGATECTFTCQDKAGEKHDTVFGAGDFTASADGTRIEVSDDMLVGYMRNACSVAMSELDTEVDATVKVTLVDGSCLSHNMAIGG